MQEPVRKNEGGQRERSSERQRERERRERGHERERDSVGDGAKTHRDLRASPLTVSKSIRIHIMAPASPHHSNPVQLGAWNPEIAAPRPEILHRSRSAARGFDSGMCISACLCAFAVSILEFCEMDGRPQTESQVCFAKLDFKTTTMRPPYPRSCEPQAWVFGSNMWKIGRTNRTNMWCEYVLFCSM